MILGDFQKTVESWTVTGRPGRHFWLCSARSFESEDGGGEGRVLTICPGRPPGQGKSEALR